MSTVLWASLIQSAVSLAAVVLAFFLGKRQGRDQALYTKRAEVIIELRRRVLELSEYLALYPHKHPPTEDDKELIGKLDALSRYHEDNLPWLEPRTSQKVDLIRSTFWQQSAEASKALRERSTDESQTGLIEWQRDVYRPLMDELEGEARRLIGTRRGWQPNRGWRTGSASDFLRYVMRDEERADALESQRPWWRRIFR